MPSSLRIENRRLKSRNVTISRRSLSHGALGVAFQCRSSGADVANEGQPPRRTTAEITEGAAPLIVIV